MLEGSKQGSILSDLNPFVIWGGRLGYRRFTVCPTQIERSQCNWQVIYTVHLVDCHGLSALQFSPKKCLPFRQYWSLQSLGARAIVMVNKPLFTEAIRQPSYISCIGTGNTGSRATNDGQEVINCAMSDFFFLEQFNYYGVQ